MAVSEVQGDCDLLSIVSARWYCGTECECLITMTIGDHGNMAAAHLIYRRVLGVIVLRLLTDIMQYYGAVSHDITGAVMVSMMVVVRQAKDCLSFIVLVPLVGVRT